MSAYFLDLDGRASSILVPGGRTRTFWADQMLVSRVDFDPLVVVPEHSHPHEQFGVVLTGELRLTIAGELLVLHAGDMYLIPGDVPHSAEAGTEGFTAAEVFSPVRETLQY